MTQAPKYQESFQDAAGRMALPWRRWVEAVDRALNTTTDAALAADVAAIATALGSPDGTVANIPDQDSLSGVIRQGSGIAVTGRLGVTPVTISLRLSDALAADLPYDNAASGLTATDVQAALDEVAANGGTLPTGTGFRHITSGVEDGAAVTIDGQSSASAGDVKVIAPATHAATSKATPVDADELPLADSAASWVLKKLTLANLKAAIFDSPALTGTPTAPTASVGSTSTQIANMSAVATAVANGPSGTGTWSLVRKTSDEARSSVTTVADDSQLTVTLAAGTRYRVRFSIAINQASAGVGFNFKINYTGTTTLVEGRRWQQLATATSATEALETSLFDAFYTTVSAGTSYFEWVYIITTNTAGTLSFQWAQRTSSANQTAMRAGSYIEYAAF